jgi:hypothetical protein
MSVPARLEGMVEGFGAIRASDDESPDFSEGEPPGRAARRGRRVADKRTVDSGPAKVTGLVAGAIAAACGARPS